MENHRNKLKTIRMLDKFGIRYTAPYLINSLRIKLSKYHLDDGWNVKLQMNLKLTETIIFIIEMIIFLLISHFEI